MVPFTLSEIINSTNQENLRNRKLPSLMSFTLHQLRNTKLHRLVICVRRIPINVLEDLDLNLRCLA